MEEGFCIMRQKDAIAACIQATSTKDYAIEAYCSLEQLGVVPRESNIQPLDTKNYAIILYHTAIKRGWDKI